MSIEVREISRNFGRFAALRDVNLEVREGELVALLGPSGSGKTTLLRIIAGLDFADHGTVWLDGVDATRLGARDRRVGFVFQHYALFRHMSVFDNVAFGLQVRPRRSRLPKPEIAERVHELLQLVQLDGFAARMPSQLSGGQRQRVALARALAVEPRVLLLDEPFGALDARVRRDLRRWLRRLHDELHVTTVFVTHDQEEAMEVADRIVVMDRGRVAQVGTVDSVYENPATPFVFEFLGNANVIPVEVRGREVFLPGSRTPLVTDSIHESGPAVLYVRPADLRVAQEDQPALEVVVDQVLRTGPLVHAEARVVATGSPVAIEMPHLHHDTRDVVPGARLHLRLLQFSVYPSPAPAQPATGHDAIGVAATRRRTTA
ncbi:MAG TPA: TOBE-like domain-containing protein [Myxococcota bacterium]|nr:TOBE-like domain-containing protein [Myxococcota bacterium]